VSKFQQNRRWTAVRDLHGTFNKDSTIVKIQKYADDFVFADTSTLTIYAYPAIGKKVCPSASQQIVRIRKRSRRSFNLQDQIRFRRRQQMEVVSIAGFRGKPSGVYIYRFDGAKWTREILDEGNVSAASCAATDLDGDRKPEIACIGQATHNLVLWHIAP
jgi:hypothetical protein